MQVIKRDGSRQDFNLDKIKNAIWKALKACGRNDEDQLEYIINHVDYQLNKSYKSPITVEEIQDIVEDSLMSIDHDVAKAFILYREKHKQIREFTEKKKDFIEKYKQSSNTANATIDDNSNVGSKNIGVMNAEIHKPDNQQISRRMIMDKLKTLYPDFDYKQYERDLNSHIIYKHDESTFAGAIAPYCCSISMYPFLLNGIKKLGGLSAQPKNLDSFCGMYVNLIFAVASQFAGAVATSEFLLYFDYFARKEWGDNYYTHVDDIISSEFCNRTKTIKSQIEQHFQQVIYSINQPAASRGMQSAFVNFSYFDKPFFDGMFEDFYFPDGSQPVWESLCWLQKEFMQWFNNERLKCMLTFPVESVSLLYKDGEFVDKDMFEFVCKEYSRGHSFFTYISDSVDSLSSCCRLKNKVQTKEFSFTNGNIGIETGSKSVITLNLNRIIQDWSESEKRWSAAPWTQAEARKHYDRLSAYLNDILDRVYKYHIAYNEGLWDMHDAGLLPVYSAGFLHLDKQYLTIGLNGLNQAAEFLGMQCTDNKDYKEFCQCIFGTIKDANTKHNGVVFNHKVTFNTEQVPAESLAIKNYNWDKEDGYWVPEDTNLYASYIFKPNENISVLEKLRLHGKEYIGDYLDGRQICLL